MGPRRSVLTLVIGLLYLTLLVSGCTQKPEKPSDLINVMQIQGDKVITTDLLAPQQELLTRLEQTTPPGKFQVEIQDGVVQRIGMQLSTEQLKLSSMSTPQEMASAFLEQYSDLLQVPDTQLSFPLRIIKGQEEQKLFYTQTINGVPVLGSWLKIAVAKKDGQRTITRFSGRYLTNSGKITPWIIPPVQKQVSHLFKSSVWMK